MADGVKWDIDIPVKTESAKAADAVLEKMDRHLNQIEGHAAGAAGHVNKLGEASHRAGEHAHGLFGEIFKAELAKDLVEKLTEKFIELGKEIIHVAAEHQRMQRVFVSAAGGNKELGEANEKWTELLSKKTEFSEEQTAGAFLDLKRVGMSDQQAKLSEKAAADIAAVSKNKNEAFEATVSAFARLERTGTISNRTLAPLGLGVKDFKSLDSMKGLSDKEVKKRMEEGKVDKNDLFRLIMSHTGETGIGQKAADNADLLGTKLEKLSELPTRFYKKLADTKAIGSLTNALDMVLNKLDPDSPTGKKISSFFGTIAEAAGSVLETVTGAIEGIDFDAVAASIKADVVPALKEMASWIKPTVEAVQDILNGFHRMYNFVNAKGEFNPYNEGNLYRGGKSQAAGLAELRLLAGGGAAKKVDLGAGVEAHHGKFVTTGEMIGKGLADGIAAGTPAAEGAAADMGDRTAKAGKKALKIESPSVVFEDIGAMTAAGFVDGIEGAQVGVDGSISRMLDMRGARGRGAGAGGGGRGDIALSFGDIYIQVDGGRDGAEQGQRAADAFKLHVRAEVLDLLEQMRAEAGA